MKQVATTIDPYDAWVFAALRAGRDLNGEVDRVSAPYRSFAMRLGAAAVEDRERLWGLFLETIPDGEADDLVDLVARATPDSPPPEGEPWEPLRLGDLPSVPDFPIDVFPYDVGRIVVEASRAVGCDPGFIAGPVLATAGGLIGRSVTLCLGSNWFAHSNIFLACIGLPGDGKSPGTEYASEPAREFEKALAEAFAVEKKSYKESLRDARRNKAKDSDPVSDPPVSRRAYVDDVTLESLFLVLSDNPRGVLMVRDELSSLILGLNQYKGGAGNDRPNLMKVWSNKSFTIDRVRNELREPTRIPHPSLSITGNLPPAMLVDMMSRRGDDGFMDRWLFVYPDRRPKLRSAERVPVSNDAVLRWRSVAEALFERPLNVEDGGTRPHVVYFSNQAKREFECLHDLHVDEFNAFDFPDHLRGPWSKLEEYAGRFSLILTLLRHAADPTADRSVLPLVGVSEVQNAWRLVKYFKAHHFRVRAFLQGKGVGGAPEGVKLILRWIRNHPAREAFSERDLHLSYPPSRGYDRAMLADGLEWLCQRNAVRRAAQPTRPRGATGRKPSPLWEVHPDLSEAQRNQRSQRNSDPDGGSVDFVDSVAREEIEEGGGNDE